MEWWGRMMVPIKNGWFKVARRLGYRKTGVLRLRHDVRSCEYEDVHVLWDMLQKNEKELIKSTEGRRKGHFWSIIDWAKRTQSLCHHHV